MVNMYDQSSAFDLVNYRIVKAKIEALGFENYEVELYSHFVCDRRQYVHVKGRDSVTDEVECGAPQAH